MPEDSPPSPQAVFEGAPVWGTPIIGLLYLLAPCLMGVVAVLLVSVARGLPWLTPVRQAAVFAFLGGAGLWGSWLLLRVAMRRRGRVEVWPERLVIQKHWSRREELTWDEVRYSLGSEAYVQLYRQDAPRPEAALTIPTPDPSQRAAVLALMEERDVPRA